MSQNFCRVTYELFVVFPLDDKNIIRVSYAFPHIYFNNPFKDVFARK